jgi:hypothetical protein
MKFLLAGFLVLLSLPALGQSYASFNGDCAIGGQLAILNNLNSTGTFDPNTQTSAVPGNILASYPQCSVTVYLTGTLTKASIFSDNQGQHALSNPFNATVYGQIFFYVLSPLVVDVVENTGAGPTMPIPKTLTAVPLSVPGGGTVTSFSADANIGSNLLSTTVANPTTTPDLHFSTPAVGSYSVYGNCTGSSATPLFCPLNVSMFPFTYSGNTTKLATVFGTLTGSSGAAVCQDGNGNIQGTCPGAGVISWNGRTGNVTPQNGDYTISQVTGGAPLASPALTGTPTSPTASTSDDTTQIATDQFVHNVVSSIATGVTSVNGQTGAVSLTVSNIPGAAPLASPALTGVPTAPTAATNDTSSQIATDAFVTGQAGTAVPIVDGTGTPGVSLLYARQDHVHPTDSSRAPINSPNFQNSITTPVIDMLGSTSGVATIQVAAVAGTPNPINLPILTGNPGDVFQTDGGSPNQQASWSPRAKVYACGTTTTCSASLQTNPQIVQGTVTLVAGTATVTGLPTFTSTSTYGCTASDLTTATDGANATPLSATSITVKGNSTDVVSYHCVGD